MAQSDPNGLFAMVELNYQGIFTHNRFSYTGGVIMNRTSNDHFLSKLCVNVEEEKNIVNYDDGREIEPTMHSFHF